MAGRQDFFEHYDEFFGHGSLPTVAAANDVRSSGPYFMNVVGANTTYAYATNESSGAVTLTFGDNEVQNMNLYWKDTLCLDFRQQLYFETRVKMGNSALDSATTAIIGLASARNNTIASLGTVAGFTLAADYLTTRTDDAVTDTAVNTGVTLVNAYKVLKIDATNTSDVKFYIDGTRVNRANTFTLAGLTSSTRYVQPYIQLQKTSDSNQDSITVDYIYVRGTRKF